MNILSRLFLPVILFSLPIIYPCDCVSADNKTDKLFEQKFDSIAHTKAVDALKAGKFIVMLDELSSAHSGSIVVDQNLNFLAVSPKKGMIQVSPMPSRWQGINLESNSAKIRKIKENKNGEITLEMSMSGSSLNVQVSVTLINKSSKAYITIIPSFRGEAISGYGDVLPLELFPQIESHLK